ncbi:MAG: glycosyl hydrolase, partial [Coraliomargarita sp.]
YYDTPAPASEIIQKESIINLTSKMNAKGELDWEVPPGNWTVLRFGHTPTGSVVRPAGAGAQGLENDKLSKESLEVHWAQAIQPWLDDPETRELFDTVHIDSFEAGSQNWTPKMLEAFNARNGYDMTPYLPVMIGRVVDSDLDSERFLWDLRTTICDMITDNYFVHFRDLCHAAGKQSSLEAYGDNGTLNVVAAAKTADLPMVENGGYYYTKMASSPAHLYGKKVITTESFTASPAQGSDWSSAFWDLKPWGDSFFAAGANHIGYHVYTAQPFDDSVRPGLTLGTWGTHFHRTHTWWKEMPAFSTYLARSSYLLQQGHFVGDVLFFYGEGAPKNYSFPKLHGDSIYALPRGYDCDFGDLDVLLTRITVKDGMLTTPDGIAYKILVVPNESDAMTPQLVKRIGELVKAGATVMAPKPKLSPSLRSQPQADAYIRKMADEIWGDCDGVQATEHAYGKGKIVWGDSLAAVLAQEGMEPAVISPVLTGVHQNDHGTTRGHWKWIQRQLPEGDLFFVMNGTDKQETVEFSFRTEGTSPQWFDAVTGQTRMLPEFKNSDGRVSLDLGFAPRQSGFVFFANQPKPASGQNIQQLDTLKAIEGAWTVSFDPKWGGPARTTFPTLTDWSQHADEGIKYYSGRATYTKTFTMPNGVKGERYFLDLGTVKNLANVSLNGRRLGTVWCAPWQIEIEPQVGENVVEIEVVNLWVNRLIGDMKFDPDGVERHAGGTAKRLPAWLDGSVPRSEKRYTFSLYNPWKADSPLQPSGLLGPVSIKVIESHGHQ